MAAIEEEGRDIGPDEELPSNYPLSSQRNHSSSVSNGDLQEDGLYSVRYREEFYRPSLANQPGTNYLEFVAEPLDETTEDVLEARRRTFPVTPQMFNGTNYYKAERKRLETFEDWKYQLTIRKEDLAKNGFIYTGTADKVLCVFCNGILRQWEPQDVVQQEHARNFPRCPFITGENVGNIPVPGVGNDDMGTRLRNGITSRSSASSRTAIHQQETSMPQGHLDPNQGQMVAGAGNFTCEEESVCAGVGIYSSTPVNPAMALEPARLETFVNWPAQMRQRADQLAQSGLFYTGDGDKVKCFFCDILLYDWESDDDPFVEHARFSPHCEYLLLTKGENFVKDVQSGKKAEDSWQQTPAVQAVLSTGKSLESVQKGLAVFKEKHGADMVVTAAELLNTILEFEDDDAGNPPQSLPQVSNGLAQSDEMEQLQRENESLRNKQMCKICMERDVDVVFYPCKHVVCCAICGASVSSCPVCRVSIQSMDKVYIT